MKDWFNGLTRRERLLVAGGGTVLLIIAVWLLVVEPLSERRAMVEQAVPSQRALLAWMKEVSPTGDTSTVSGSLFAIVDRSARNTGLAGTVSRIQPEGQDTVRLWLDATPFDDLVMWLAAIEREAGVAVTALSVDRAGEPGLVNARLTLERR